MAEHLELDPDEILGKLVRIWAWMDSHFDEMSASCHKLSVTLVQIDRVAGVKNFGQAMLDVGWMSSEGIPNFDRHLGESSKKRAKDAERKRLSRISSKASPKSGHKNSGQKVGPEEEEEEDKKRTKRLMSENKFSDRDMACAENIYQRVLDVAPHTKKPNFEKWADTIRLMREQDKISHEQIWRVFDFANRDEFWRTNILGPDKLRKQFGQLDAKMNSVPTNQTRQQKIQEKSFDAIDNWEPTDAIQ
jgi:hypothetical protein